MERAANTNTIRRVLDCDMQPGKGRRSSLAKTPSQAHDAKMENRLGKIKKVTGWDEWGYVVDAHYNVTSKSHHGIMEPPNKADREYLKRQARHTVPTARIWWLYA